MIMEWHGDCEILFYSTDGRPVHDIITTLAALSNLTPRIKKAPLRKSLIIINC